MRVRRFEAGELEGEERARTAEHVEGCARCQATRAELAAERAALESSLPFESFAAGVAERLARGEAAQRARPLVLSWRRRLLPALALAAGLVVAAALPVLLDVGPREDQGGPGERPKGAASLTLHVRHGGAVHALAEGEPVPAGAALRMELAPGGRPHVAIALVDADGATVLHAGPATPGLLPGAFEWTGAGEGTLVAVLDDSPVDPDALAARLRAGGVAAAAPRAGAEVVTLPLVRGAR
jgi:hypothetical protein